MNGKIPFVEEQRARERAGEDGYFANRYRELIRERLRNEGYEDQPRDIEVLAYRGCSDRGAPSRKESIMVKVTECFTVLALSALVMGPVVLAQAPSDDTELPGGDRAFVAQTEHSGTMEGELGKLALRNSGNERVKRFAQRMIDDRAKLDDGLVRAAKAQGVRVVPELMPYQKTTIEWIARLKGVAFDREYMQLAVMDQRSMRDEFRVEAEKGQVPALKGLAQTALPTLENDLQDGVRARLQMSSADAS
jgi:predicted outer membrane protein